MNQDFQTVILVDNHDKFLGYEQRKKCHTGLGIHHRAFVVLLENKKRKVLMQKRKHALWNNFWDTTAISHPLRLDNHDESYEEAGARALKNEMGIEGVDLKNIGGFNYFAAHGASCENEYCAILIGEYNGKVNANKDVVYTYKWVPKEEFIKQSTKKNPNYTPWAILAGKFLQKGITI